MRSKVLRSFVARSGDSRARPFSLRTETGTVATTVVYQERRSYVAVRRAGASALAIILVSGVAACSTSTATSAAPSTRATSNAPSSSAANSSVAPSEASAAQAVALIPTYLQVIDDLYLESSRSLDDVYEVAVAPEATSEANAIGTFRTQEYRQVGRAQLVTSSVSSVDLTTDPTASPSP